jgi:SAM-dependent methyltransferase
MSFTKRMGRLVGYFATPETKHRIKTMHSKAQAVIGYSPELLVQVVRRREWRRFLKQESTNAPDILEISPGRLYPWREYATGSYTPTEWPDFDITRERLPQVFDVIIAEEVFEHLDNVDAAADNVRAMLRPNGVFLISVPFLIRIHGPPEYCDFRRWTPDGLTAFLMAHGFSNIEARSWGNAKAVIANFKNWKVYGFGQDLRNDPNLPVSVWAYARL